MHATTHRAPLRGASFCSATVLLGGALAWLHAAGPAHASVLLYDGVPTSGTGLYNSGVKLKDQNPTHTSIIGETGTWSSLDNSDTSVLQVNATTLGYPVGVYLSGLGGAVRATHTDSGGTNVRSLKRAVSPALGGKSFYFSALMAFNDLASLSNAGYQVCGLTRTRTNTAAYPAADGFLVGFQKNGTQVDAVLRVLGTAYTLQANVSPGTYFFTVKLAYNASGSDTVYAALNATSTEPTTWTTNVTAEVLTSSQTLAWVNVGGNYGLNGKYVAFDEWRVGDSYADVAGSATPPPEGLPVVANAAAVATSKTTATFTGNLATAAPPATVYACWDVSDKGTGTTGAWSRVELVGTYSTPVALSYGLTGLLANNAYYCRFYATNSLGSVWSDSASFATAKPTLSITDAYAYEGHAGATPISLAVTLDVASASNTVVTFATRDSSATGGVDYVASSGQLTIPSGVVSTNLTFSILGNVREAFPGKRFWVDLSAPVGGTLSSASAEAGILDDDMGKPLFYDDFNDDNAVGWSALTGSCTVVSKTYRTIGGDNLNANTQAGDAIWGDYGLRVMVRNNAPWQGTTLRLHAQGAADPAGGYIFTFQRTDGFQMYTGSIKAGTNTLASTAAQYVPDTRIGTTIARPAAIRLRTTADGLRIQCYIGFKLIYDVVDPLGRYPLGKIGVGSVSYGENFFDNVEVFAEPLPPATVISIR